MLRLVKYTIKNYLDEPIVVEEDFNDIKIGKVLLYNSKFCILNNKPADMMVLMGEYPYDQGGYLLLMVKKK